jgi:uncharacterized protein YggU (UPF0235/DUF167 family)
MGAETTRLRLRVSPGARRAAVVGRQGDAWKVRVAEAPERGHANEAVLRLLADALTLPRTALTLVSGHGARDKIVELTGIGPGLIERRLSSAAATGPGAAKGGDSGLRPGADGSAGGVSSHRRKKEERR